MNPVLAVQTAQEFIAPAFTNDGGIAVAFFQQNKLQFCIPVKSEQEAINLAIKLQEMICQAIQRYEVYSEMASKLPPEQVYHAEVPPEAQTPVKTQQDAPTKGSKSA